MVAAAQVVDQVVHHLQQGGVLVVSADWLVVGVMFVAVVAAANVVAVVVEVAAVCVVAVMVAAVTVAFGVAMAAVMDVAGVQAVADAAGLVVAVDVVVGLDGLGVADEKKWEELMRA